MYFFADFENPALRDAEAAVDSVRVGGGGAAAAAEAAGQRQEDQPRGPGRGAAAGAVFRGTTGQRGQIKKEAPGRLINRNFFGLNFGLCRLRFRFDSETCLIKVSWSTLPIFEHFLSLENLKPKLKWFFKPKLKPIIFY